jgi:hypothetical protein
MTRTLALLALFLPSSVGAEVQPKKAFYDETFSGELAPVELWLPGGGYAVLEFDFDAGTITPVFPDLGLTEAAVAAVARVPAWMQPRLALTLSKLEAARQDEVVAILPEYEQDVTLDELAYSIAATTPEELSIDGRYGLLEVLQANAEAIYDIDPYVPFADLVELEDGSTTVEYHYDVGDGLESTTIDKELYYRHVVNPKLDMELPLFMDPESFSLSDPPRGVHWRDWFFFSALESGTWDYRTHWLQEEPVAVDEDEYATLEARGWLHDFTVDPIVILQDEAGLPLLVEMDWGKGSVLATSLDLSRALDDGSVLVENMLEYAQRRDVLEVDEATLLLGADGETGAAILGWFEAMALPVDSWDSSLGAPSYDGYAKVVLPRGMSNDDYELLFDAKNAEALESFVSGGGTVLIQMEQDLGDYDYPCGFSATVEEVGTPETLGHPVLGESIAAMESLWDGERHDSLSGERALAEASSAVDAIGWFVTQNMFDNVSEYSSTHSDYDGERSVWPQRIMHNHFGNCGECQDMMTAAARACLIPTINVWSIEDHVWNEFYAFGWHAWQVDWSDGPTRIDNGGVGADSSYGGGKEVSAIMAFHQNGLVTDEHVALYTDTITANVTVTDADGDPVPGAMVLVAVENYYYDQYLDQAAWVHTDQQGQVEITLGDNRSFWFLAAADLQGEEVWAPYSIPEIQSGSYPNWFLTSEAGDPTIAWDEAVAGSSHTVELRLPGALGADVGYPGAPPEGEDELEITLDLALDATLLDVRAGHTYLGWYSELGYAYGGGLIEPLDEPGTIDMYLVDADNLALYEAGEPFAYIDAVRGASTHSLDLEMFGDGGVLYAILCNRANANHAHHGFVTASAWSGFGMGPDCGGCTSSPRRNPIALLGLLAMLGLALRRRR